MKKVKLKTPHEEASIIIIYAVFASAPIQATYPEGTR